MADEESDLILYDIRNNAVSVIENDPYELECFPAWSPDGRMLYYVSAHYDAPIDADRRNRVFLDSRNIRYDLYRKPFDPDTRTWGPKELILETSAMDKSATLPRVSPDGRLLMFAVAPYGVFHIWHREADLWLMDLENDSVWCLVPFGVASLSASPFFTSVFRRHERLEGIFVFDFDVL